MELSNVSILFRTPPNILIGLTSLLTINIIACSNAISTDAKVNETTVVNLKQTNQANYKLAEEKYAKYFSVFVDFTRPHIQPATGGILIEEDGCLLVQSGSEKYVPIFPDNATTWNEETKTLTSMGKEIKLGDSFIFAGGSSDNVKRYGGLNFIKKADPKCTKNRHYMKFWGR